LTVRNSAVYATLQSDPLGRVDLGPLVGIDSLEINHRGQSSFNDLRDIETSWPWRINSVAATDIRLALPSATADAKRFRLLSLRGGEHLEPDLSSLIAIGGGHLTTRQIEAGNCQLHDIELGKHVLLCVTDGPILTDIAVGEVRQLELEPRLQVSDSATRQPVEGAYVKVYARNQDGSVSFYTDGYTDLRGRYDYVSLSTSDLASVQRFSILVIDPERGATLEEAAPPTR